MNSLKDQMNEVYKNQHFDLERQQETLQKVHLKEAVKRKFYWQPFIATLGIAFITLMFMYFQVEQQQVTLPASSELAPEYAEVAFMDRLTQFQQIIADGAISEEERRQFLSTSDWLLQRAFESGNSLFYNRPKMTAQEVLQVNKLLSYMVEFIEQNEDVRKLSTIQMESESFREVLAIIPEWNAHFTTLIRNTYVPTNEEKPRTNNAFLNGSFLFQLVWILGFLIVVYTFVVNVRYMRKKLLGLIQLILIIYFGSAFFKEDIGLYGHDETTIMESFIKHNAAFDEWQRPELLLTAATFNNERFALAQLTENRGIGLATFSKADRNYMLNSSSMHESASILTEHSSYSDTEKGIIVGIADNSNISKVAVIDHHTNEQYGIEVDPVKANIYRIMIPKQLKSYLINVYDVEGNYVEW